MSPILVVVALLIADDPPSVTFARGIAAYERLSEGKKSYVRRMRIPRPLPTRLERWPPEERDCWIFQMTSGKIIATAENETIVFFGGQKFILRSQYVAKADADPSFKWPAMIVAVGDSDDGGLVIEEIDPKNADIVAAIAKDSMGRRLRRFERVGDLYFRDLKDGKYRGWKFDGAEVEIDASNVTRADVRWIKQYRENEKLHDECRRIDSLAGTRRHESELELFKLRHH